MKFNFDMVTKLIEMMEGDKIDQKLYDNFLELQEVKDFIAHEKELGRKTDEVTLKEQIRMALEGETDIFKCNGFNVIKKNLGLLRRNLEKIINEEEEVKARIFSKVDTYSSKEKLGDITVYLYAGGLDYGYSLESGKTYVNIGMLSDKLEYFEDIMAHECYHAREREGEFLGYDFTENNYLKLLMFHILEEGIATLIQFGCPKAYDEFTFIRKADFDNTYMHFDNLDKCIREIEIEGNYSTETIVNYFGNSIPNYIVGYKIGEVLFNYGGREQLNMWSVDGDYKGCFKKYIEITRDKGIKSGFSIEVEDLLLGLK